MAQPTAKIPPNPWASWLLLHKPKTSIVLILTQHQTHTGSPQTSPTRPHTRVHTKPVTHTRVHQNLEREWAVRSLSERETEPSRWEKEKTRGREKKEQLRGREAMLGLSEPKISTTGGGAAVHSSGEGTRILAMVALVRSRWESSERERQKKERKWDREMREAAGEEREKGKDGSG